MSDQHSTCPLGCCARLALIREKERIRDRRWAKRHPDKIREQWRRSNAKRDARNREARKAREAYLAGASGPLPPPGDDERHEEPSPPTTP